MLAEEEAAGLAAEGTSREELDFERYRFVQTLQCTAAVVINVCVRLLYK